MIWMLGAPQNDTNNVILAWIFDFWQYVCVCHDLDVSISGWRSSEWYGCNFGLDFWWDVCVDSWWDVCLHHVLVCHDSDVRHTSEWYDGHNLILAWIFGEMCCGWKIKIIPALMDESYKNWVTLKNIKISIGSQVLKLFSHEWVKLTLPVLRTVT